jgi:hypothetical protein
MPGSAHRKRLASSFPTPYWTPSAIERGRSSAHSTVVRSYVPSVIGGVKATGGMVPSAGAAPAMNGEYRGHTGVTRTVPHAQRGQE